jgi:hypothetical protein
MFGLSNHQLSSNVQVPVQTVVQRLEDLNTRTRFEIKPWPMGSITRGVYFKTTQVSPPSVDLNK